MSLQDLMNYGATAFNLPWWALAGVACIVSLRVTGRLPQSESECDGDLQVDQ